MPRNRLLSVVLICAVVLLVCVAASRSQRPTFVAIQDVSFLAGKQLGPEPLPEGQQRLRCYMALADDGDLYWSCLVSVQGEKASETMRAKWELIPPLE